MRVALISVSLEFSHCCELVVRAVRIPPWKTFFCICCAENSYYSYFQQNVFSSPFSSSYPSYPSYFSPSSSFSATDSLIDSQNFLAVHSLIQFFSKALPVCWVVVEVLQYQFF